jgi:hypothetical protein
MAFARQHDGAVRSVENGVAERDSFVEPARIDVNTGMGADSHE